MEGFVLGLECVKCEDGEAWGLGSECLCVILAGHSCGLDPTQAQLSQQDYQLGPGEGEEDVMN